MSMSFVSKCNCGSGSEGFPEFDARGIFISFCCDNCRKEKLAPYHPEVLVDPSYKADEPIEPQK